MHVSKTVTGRNVLSRVTNPLTGEDSYIPYEGLLPPGVENWVAGWVTALDNFDSLGEQNMENLYKKFMTVLSASLIDDGGLSAIEPIIEIFNGNTSSFPTLDSTPA